MFLYDLVQASQRVAETSARGLKVALLASVFSGLEPDEIEITIGFLSGWPRQGRLGVGWASLQEAIGEALPPETPSLDLRAVDQYLGRIKAASGKGSSAEKLRLLREMLSRATKEEQRFLVAMALGEIRQGALEGLLVEAVARAAGLPADRVRRAVMFAGDLGAVARAVLTEGETGLAQYRMQLFRPVLPMLAQTAETVEDALAQLGVAALEFKLDGARVQVHKSGRDVAIYSRNLNDVTVAVPEVVEAVREFPAWELVLDGEVIALGPEGRPRPFQVTMRRFGRKLDVARQREELPVTACFFDVLALEGQELIDLAQSERSARMSQVVPERFLVPRMVTGDLPEARRFWERALAAGHEGIMVKALGAPYEAGRRGQGWLKVKAASTLDLVVLAAEWGHGRRRGWLSNLHLGARDEAGGGFVMLGKTFKGMTDEMLAWQTQELLARETGRDGHTVYVRPELVVEVAFNDLQESPHYPGGLALRFARVKGYRPDKAAAEADTIETVREIHRRSR